MLVGTHFVVNVFVDMSLIVLLIHLISVCRTVDDLGSSLVPGVSGSVWRSRGWSIVWDGEVMWRFLLVPFLFVVSSVRLSPRIQTPKLCWFLMIHTLLCGGGFRGVFHRYLSVSFRNCGIF